MKNLLFLLLILAASSLTGQTPIPAKEKTSVALVGGTAHLGNGRVIENACVAFDEGRIVFVGQASEWKSNDFYRNIDTRGKHIYPGFIAPNTTLGLVEIDMVRATQDYSETGQFNPNVRALIAYNTDSEILPTVRTAGVLLAQIVPEGGVVSGTSSVVQLDAWNWEDAAYLPDNGIHLYWPNLYRFNFQEGRRLKNEGYEQQVQEIALFLQEARAYQGERNLKLEAMQALWTGGKKLYIHADDARAIQESVLLAGEMGLTPVLVGGADAWRVADFLKTKNVAVILKNVHSLPTREDEPVDQAYRNAAILHEAGVLFCFGMDGSWQQRNLAFQAGHAVGYGLPREVAVQALTANTAAILGIADRTGTLEMGKDANVFVSSGDMLDMRTATVEWAFIQGRQLDLDNKHKALYRKFKARYE